MNADQKVYNLLGLAERARKLTHGMDATLQAIQRRRAHGVVLARDASENSKNKVRNAALAQNVAVVTFGDKVTFGRLLGRQPVGIIGILDAGFADTIHRHGRHL